MVKSVVVAALYKFVRLEECAALKQALLELCQTHSIKGTLLLASEGINGTIAGSRTGIDAVKAFLEADPRFCDLEYKESFADTMPFYRLKIRIKKEIVTLGVPEVDPTQRKGTYVEWKQWNDLLKDPEVLVLDVRNIYETQVGMYKGALDPQTRSFREFPHFVQTRLDPKKHKKVAMSCTGGIRCEKASSYMLQAGFEEVYHLKGGVLKYLETAPPEENLWEGECFVFDQRTTVKEGLAPGDFSTCYGCRYPVSPEDRNSPLFMEGVSCPHCHDSLTPEKKRRFMERHRQCHRASTQGLKHLGS